MGFYSVTAAAYLRSGLKNSKGELETAGFCPGRIKNITPNYPKVVLQMFDKVKHAHLQTAAAPAKTAAAIAPAIRRARRPGTEEESERGSARV